ncbi:MAG: PEGA domain-containing protein [Deltaproteobacteria bacterium]|nr:MAG: PEGA domain-containing protein [Deltaproteobacteria bacterium]
MKRFCSSACLAAVISLLSSVIWPSHSVAALPALVPLGQLRAQGLDVPVAMAVDGAANLYVADARGGEVFKFDRYGRVKAVFDAQATGRGLAVSADGSRLYVAGQGRVAAIDAASGAPLFDLSGVAFDLAGEVELDAAGNVYVADVGPDRQSINIFSAAGQFRAKFGGAGNTAGKFRKICGMAFNSTGQLVVADESGLDNRVQVFTVDPVSYAATVAASYLTTSTANFGTPGVLGPRGVVFDGQGRGYFADFTNSQLRIVSPAMAFLGSYGTGGYAPGQLAGINDLAVDNTAGTTRLFVSCDSGRVEVFGIDGGVTPVFINHAPTVPVLQSPVAGSELPVSAPVLQFAAAVDADGDALTYQVSVFQGDKLVARIGSTATAVALTEGLLAENGAYRWVVEAFDSEGAGSGASQSANFVVNAVNEPPSAPALVAPAGGEAVDGAAVLSWQPSVDPDPNDTLLAYRLEVAADAAFVSPVLSADVAGTAIALKDFADYADLVDGAAYFWRVTATDNDGLASASAAGTFIYDTALLKVSANIAGASVYLGGNHAYAGRFVGTAPLELRDLSPGALSVVVERAGFEPYVAQVGVVAAGNSSIYAPLVPARQPAAMQLVGNGINGRTGLAVAGAAAPVLVDFDNDGRLDLLAGDAAGQLTLFAAMQVNSRGQLAFQAGKGLGLAVMPGAVPFAADWNNDGRKDLLVGLGDGTVKLFLNVGTEASPAFGGGQDVVAADSVVNVGGKAAPVVIDLDADGAKDLVVGSAAGQVLAYYNQGDDAAPQLAAPVLLAKLAAAAVPASVDWNADGRRDLLVTANGQIVPLRNDLAASGAFVVGEPQSIAGAVAAFPVELNGAKGKDLLVGQADGKLAFWAGNGTALTSAALAGMVAKVDEVEELVAAEAPTLLSDVAQLRTQVGAGSLGGASKTAEALALALPAGSARDAVTELGAMCQAK